jgi:O-antigen ligase
MVIGTLLSLSLIFNQNGEFWDSLFHPCYQIFCMIGATLLLIIHSRGNIRINRVDLSIIALLAWQLITRTSRTGSVLETDSLVVVLLIIYYVAIRHVTWDENNVLLYYKVVVITCSALSLYSLLEFTGIAGNENSSWPITGNFSNPGPLAGFLSLALPFSILLAIRNYREGYVWVAVLYAGATLFYIVIVLLCQSRAGIISGLLGVVCIAANGKFKKPANRYYYLLIIPLIALVVASKDLDSVRGRLLIWKVSLTALTEHPVMGLGHNFFAVDYLNYQADYFTSGKGTDKEVWVAGDAEHTFNESLKFILENGTTGGILMILFLIMIIRSFRGRTGLVTTSSRAFLIAFAFFSQFSYPLYFLCFKLLLLNQLSIVSGRYTRDTFNLKRRILVPLFLVVGMIAFIGSWQTYTGTRHWNEAHFLKYTDTVSAEDQFGKAYTYLDDHGLFLYTYGTFLQDTDIPKSIRLLEKSTGTYTGQKLYEALAKNYESLKRFPEAEQLYRKIHFMIPARLAPQERLMEYYLRTRQRQKASDWARHILATPMKVDSYEARKIKGRAKKALASLTGH